jgi:phosphate transport system substrate-binding protein
MHPVKHTRLALSLGLLLLATSASARAPATAAGAVPPYQRVAGIVGSLSTVGSATMANLMLLWSQAFNRFYPQVNIQIQPPGSASAPLALIEGSVRLVPMGRPMGEQERRVFQQRHGYPPTAIPVALDALAIFVHRDNPVAGVNLEQLDALFSATRRCGGNTRLDHWRQLGVAGPLGGQPVLLFGHTAVSDSHGFFRDRALCRGDFSSRVNELPGSAAVVQAVAAAIDAIGYASISHRDASVRVLPLAARGREYIAPEPEALSDGRYPLTRPLYLYLNWPPGQPLSPPLREFLRLVLSQEGQAVVSRAGYIPLPSQTIARQLRMLSNAG